MRSKWLSFEYIKGSAFKISTSWELMIDYLRKINDDFSDFAIIKLDTLNSIELKELYKKTFG
jgi:hypothetical protein